MLVEFLAGLGVIIINISRTFIGFQYDKLEIETFGLVSRIRDMGLNLSIYIRGFAKFGIKVA